MHFVGVEEKQLLRDCGGWRVHDIEEEAALVCFDSMVRTGQELQSAVGVLGSPQNLFFPTTFNSYL